MDSFEFGDSIEDLYAGDSIRPRPAKDLNMKKNTLPTISNKITPQVDDKNIELPSNGINHLKNLNTKLLEVFKKNPWAKKYFDNIREIIKIEYTPDIKVQYRIKDSPGYLTIFIDNLPFVVMSMVERILLEIKRNGSIRIEPISYEKKDKKCNVNCVLRMIIQLHSKHNENMIEYLIQKDSISEDDLKPALEEVDETDRPHIRKLIEQLIFLTNPVPSNLKVVAELYFRDEYKIFLDGCENIIVTYSMHSAVRELFLAKNIRLVCTDPIDTINNISKIRVVINEKKSHVDHTIPSNSKKRVRSDSEDEDESVSDSLFRKVVKKIKFW